MMTCFHSQKMEWIWNTWSDVLKRWPSLNNILQKIHHHIWCQTYHPPGSSSNLNKNTNNLRHGFLDTHFSGLAFTTDLEYLFYFCFCSLQHCVSVVVWICLDVPTKKLKIFILFKQFCMILNLFWHNSCQCSVCLQPITCLKVNNQQK